MTGAGSARPARVSAVSRAGGALRRRVAGVHLIMGAVFAVTRTAFRLAGVRFDASGLPGYWQFLDEPLLRDRLLESLWHQHSQPPGFNLYAGLVLKLFPATSALWFEATFLGASFAAYFLVHAGLRRAGFGGRTAFLLATAFIVAPETVLYEHWLFYTWPVAVMLLGAAEALARFERTRRPASAAVFLALCAAVCLTRSIYHLVWLVLAALLLLSVRPAPRRGLLAACAAALALVGAASFKNLALFGTFGTSSWLGMSFWHLATHAVPPATVEAGVRAGALPAIALQAPFRGLASYPPAYREVPPRFDAVPALAAERKSDGITPNFNHYGYLALSRDHGRAAWRVFAEDPGRYLAAQAKTWLTWCIPAWDYEALAGNRGAMKGWFEAATLLAPRRLLERELLGLETVLYPRSLLLTVPLAAALAAAALVLRAVASRPIARSTLFAALTVAYVAVVGNAVEFGENHRFPAETDPLLYVLALAAGREIWAAWRARRGAVRPKAARGGAQ